jgi:hypothetical protein
VVLVPVLCQNEGWTGRGLSYLTSSLAASPFVSHGMLPTLTFDSEVVVVGLRPMEGSIEVYCVVIDGMGKIGTEVESCETGGTGHDGHQNLQTRQYVSMLIEEGEGIIAAWAARWWASRKHT